MDWPAIRCCRMTWHQAQMPAGTPQVCEVEHQKLANPGHTITI
jgi:hypothetical protein